MKDIVIKRFSKDVCNERLNDSRNEIRSLTESSSGLTDFGRFCLENRRKTEKKMIEYLEFMSKNGKDYIYLIKDKPLCYEIADKLAAL